MAIDFKLEYNNNSTRTELYPATSLKAVNWIDNIYQITTMRVNIPTPTSMTQNIAISTTPELVDAYVEMYLVSTGSSASWNYGTINQFQVTTNQLTLTRLNVMPQEQITVMLVFYVPQEVS